MLTRDAVLLPDRRLAKPAVNYLLHVPTLLGRRWVAANAAGLRRAGVNPARIADLFSSGLVGASMLRKLEIEEDVPAVTTNECVAWVRACRRRRGAPTFDVFFARHHSLNGDPGFVVTLSPKPPRSWHDAFTRRFDAHTTMQAPVLSRVQIPVCMITPPSSPPRASASASA